MSKIIKEDNKIIVIPQNDIVVPIEENFKIELEDLIKESSCDFTIDLIDVERMDSLGIAVVISTYNALKEKGYKLEVVNTPEYIYDIFAALQLDDYFTIEKRIG